MSDAYSHYIMSWRASRAVHVGFVPDALEQVIADMWPFHREGLINHSDRDSQYVSINCTDCFVEARIEPSVDSVSDWIDMALAEPAKGFYKAEVIHRQVSWRSFEVV